MKVVRLFVLQDNCRSFVDVPYAEYAEVQADLEMTGATVYHASLLSPVTTKKPNSRAKLKKRLY